jgi:DNA-binding MarR family transcriptional regulator
MGTNGKRSGQVSGDDKRSGQVSGGGGDELWPLLTEFALSMRGWWISTCYGLDLTPAQGMALRSLDPDVPLAMSALADTLACDASNVTGVVDKMEARGLIARQAAENDRRVKVLVVTEKGRQVRRELLSRAAKAPPEIASIPKQTRSLLAVGLRAFLARPH